jgi:hypothetical protein
MPNTRNRSIVRRLVAVAAFSLAPACNFPGQIEESGSGTTPAATAETLTLTKVTPEEVTGSFRRGSIGLDFASERHGERVQLSLRLASGAELMTVKGDGALASFSLLGRMNATARMGAQIQMSAPSGDGDAFVKLARTPEFALLPRLSVVLGKRGINGKAYPATLALHVIAERADRMLKGLSETSVTRQALKPDHCRQIPDGCLDFDEDSCKCLKFAPIVDTCQSLLSDPNHDDCFGMCGPGCSTCWESICGDCCYHPGCAAHDTACQICVDSFGLAVDACAACGPLAPFVVAVGGC